MNQPTAAGITWTAPRDWRTGHPDSPDIKAGVVSSILAAWREAWT